MGPVHFIKLLFVVVNMNVHVHVYIHLHYSSLISCFTCLHMLILGSEGRRREEAGRSDGK